METILEFITRNANQSLDAIVDSLKAMGFTSQEISDSIKEYIDQE